MAQRIDDPRNQGVLDDWRWAKLSAFWPGTSSREVGPMCVVGRGAECAFFFFFLVEGLKEVLYRYSHGGEGSGGGMIEGSEGNVFIMTSPSLLSVNPLRGSSLH